MLSARVGLHVVGIERLRRWASRPGTSAASIARIVWAIDAVSRRVPGATCLVYSLALQRLLSRHGHVSELHIGVAKQSGILAAHAWIVCEGDRFDGKGESETHARLLAWRAAGPG